MLRDAKHSSKVRVHKFVPWIGSGNAQRQTTALRHCIQAVKAKNAVLNDSVTTIKKKTNKTKQNMQTKQKKNKKKIIITSRRHYENW